MIMLGSAIMIIAAALHPTWGAAASGRTPAAQATIVCWEDGAPMPACPTPEPIISLVTVTPDPVTMTPAPVTVTPAPVTATATATMTATATATRTATATATATRTATATATATTTATMTATPNPWDVPPATVPVPPLTGSTVNPTNQPEPSIALPGAPVTLTVTPGATPDPITPEPVNDDSGAMITTWLIIGAAIIGAIIAGIIWRKRRKRNRTLAAPPDTTPESTTDTPNEDTQIIGKA